MGPGLYKKQIWTTFIYILVFLWNKFNIYFLAMKNVVCCFLFRFWYWCYYPYTSRWSLVSLMMDLLLRKGKSSHRPCLLWFSVALVLLVKSQCLWEVKEKRKDIKPLHLTNPLLMRNLHFIANTLSFLLANKTHTENISFATYITK